MHFYSAFFRFGAVTVTITVKIMVKVKAMSRDGQVGVTSRPRWCPGTITANLSHSRWCHVKSRHATVTSRYCHVTLLSRHATVTSRNCHVTLMLRQITLVSLHLTPLKRDVTSRLHDSNVIFNVF